jgi:hypothetical protein
MPSTRAIGPYVGGAACRFVASRWPWRLRLLAGPGSRILSCCPSVRGRSCMLHLHVACCDLHIAGPHVACCIIHGCMVHAEARTSSLCRSHSGGELNPHAAGHKSSAESFGMARTSAQRVRKFGGDSARWGYPLCMGVGCISMVAAAMLCDGQRSHSNNVGCLTVVLCALCMRAT